MFSSHSQDTRVNKNFKINANISQCEAWGSYILLRVNEVACWAGVGVGPSVVKVVAWNYKRKQAGSYKVLVIVLSGLVREIEKSQ